MKSRALVVEQVNQVALREIELPPMQADELLVRSTLTAVSIGTERWAFIGKRPEMKYPLIPGYLGVGIVEQAGEKAAGFVPGDRVFFSKARLPEPFAKPGNWMGTHLSHALVPTTIGQDWPPYMCKVPDGIDDVSAALAGLAAVAVQGADMIRITSKDTAVVLGMGMIGQCSAQVLRARGARVVVADLLPDRVHKALAVGCEAGVVLNGGPIAPQLAPHLPAGGADIVVDTTSVAPVVQQLGSLVKHRGQIILQGYYPGLTPVDFDALHVKRPLIAVPCSMDLPSHLYAYRLILGGQLRLTSLLTHRFLPTQVAQAYDMMVQRPNEFLAMAFDWKEGATHA